MLLFIILFIATIFLAYTNGANDNFKGVATLFGSDTVNYRLAIGWATITTFAGSITSIFFAETLVKNFSGKGLVPDVVAASPDFLLAVALGAGLTVLIATLTGFPISTTHSLIGALFGTGLAAVGTQVNVSMLGSKFFLPLLLSPMIALVLGGICYLIFRGTRQMLQVDKEVCLCIGETEKTIPVVYPDGTLSLRAIMTPDIAIDIKENCTQRYTGNFLGITLQRLLDSAHFLSSGIVSFARGLNDTPKIVGLLLVINAFDLNTGIFAVAAGMAVGGLFNARKVAMTMSKKITSLSHGQGFTANLVTGFLVIFASRMGVPVSTTHVSVGSLFGIGMVTKEADKKVVSSILLSWILTLPIAAILGAAIYFVIKI